jgi:CheY-like chemotaxis protein
MSYCILAIDDDRSIHRFIDEALQPEGFEVLHAMNGLEGLTTAMCTPVDLIVLDINMPVMDGFKTLSALRSKPKTRDLPIIMLSSHATEKVKIQGLDLGADDYVTKPFKPAEFQARVRAALRRSKRYHQNETVFQGELSDISIPDLVQTMALGNKSGLVHFPDMEAQFFFNKGALAMASCMTFTGVEAVLRVLLLERGRFSVEFMPFPETLEDLTVSTQHLLMSGIAYIDELRGIVQNECPMNAAVDVGGSQLPAILELKLRNPLSVSELIARMSGDLKRNAEAVLGEIRRGNIVFRGRAE